MAGRGQGNRDISPMIRGAFIRAARRLDDEGQPLSELVYKYLKSDFLATLTAMSRFCPKDVNLGGEIKHSLSEIIQRIDARTIEGRAALPALEDKRAGDIRH